ncbi:Hypothetical predicted protein, partial [Pelobates cultripes]
AHTMGCRSRKPASECVQQSRDIGTMFSAHKMTAIAEPEAYQLETNRDKEETSVLLAHTLKLSITDDTQAPVMKQDIYSLLQDFCR